MTKRRRSPNPRRIKIHYPYKVEDVVRVLGVHKNTVRRWLDEGLATIDHHKPAMIRGAVLRQFLETRRAKAKRPCRAGQIYCLRCRAPKEPAYQMADYQPYTATTGNLQGLCPDCAGLINRRVSWAKIEAIRGNLNIARQQAQARLSERASPSVDGDFEGQR